MDRTTSYYGSAPIRANYGSANSGWRTRPARNPWAPRPARALVVKSNTPRAMSSFDHAAIPFFAGLHNELIEQGYLDPDMCSPRLTEWIELWGQ